MGIFQRLYGSAVVAHHLRGQKRVPYLDRDSLAAIRDRRVRSIVQYAARNVPYYRDMFREQGIDARDIRTAADLERLPLLDKNLARSNPRLFVAETPAAQNAIPFLSSGSTGTPTTIYQDRHSLLANIAYGERERAAIIELCGAGFRPKEVYAGYESSTFQQVIGFYEANVLLPVRPNRHLVSILEPIDRAVEVVIRERPDILVGYGGWIHQFFRVIDARGIRIPLPRLVLYMGEALPYGGRAFIEERFGVPVISRYNAVEAFKIGFFCERRTGFHIHEDLCHVRIAGADGRTLPAGEQGQIVISNLVNRATVLLNYPMGDVASMSAEDCPCGRAFRMLSELEGRVEDMLPRPGGESIHPRAIWKIFKNMQDVLQYQLTQQELNQFRLTLVTRDEASFQRSVAESVPELQKLLGGAAQVESCRQPEFLRKEGGKFRAVTAVRI